MCSEFYDKIKIIHFSDVSPNCEHIPINKFILKLFSPVMEISPNDCSIVLEYTPVRPIELEVDFIRNNFPKYGIDIDI